VKKELLVFQHYYVDVKEIKCLSPLMVGETWSHVSHIWVVHQILWIVGSQIEIEWIFSLVGILANLGKCHSHSKNLKKLFLWTKIGLMIVELVVNPLLTF
jgi:hypothetical protein